MATVQSLVYYPVKGCAGTTVDRAEVVTTGLTHDRSFMLVEPDGTFLSQRVLPSMAVLRPAVLDDGKRLALALPDHGDIEIEVAFAGPRKNVSLFGKWFGDGVDQGDEVADWCSDALGQPVRLVRVPADHDRDGWGEHPGKTGFADAHAILVTALSSLDELNARILEHGAEPVPMNRFRANIIVTGWPEPHTEDRVRLMSVGGAEFGYSTRAVRCAVPTVEQETGHRDGPEPTRTLAGYRREPELGGGVSFGTKMAVLREGVVTVGDEITVHTWAS